MKYKADVSAPFNGTEPESKAGADNQKFVNAKDLLELLWTKASRPSLRWLREQQARRAIPFVKLGARVWFDPTEVKQHLTNKWTVRRKG